MLRSSRDLAINGLAVTLDTVRRLSLSSSSMSQLRLLPINSRNTDLVERFCCNWPLPSPGTLSVSLLMFVESASCTGGAEWIENNEPAVLNSLNSATFPGSVE